MGARLVRGLYDPRNEHDACGVGFVAISRARTLHAGKPHASRRGRCQPADGRRRGHSHPDPDRFFREGDGEAGRDPAEGGRMPRDEALIARFKEVISEVWPRRARLPRRAGQSTI